MSIKYNKIKLWEGEKHMVKFETYVVGSEKGEAYWALKNTIPLEDKYMHYRLDGACLNDCVDIYFVAHEDGKALCRIWMCYPRHENAICNWGAVYTLEECRGRGICNKTLAFCMDEIAKLENSPVGLFCTSGQQWITDMYLKFGFTTAITGMTKGPLYRPLVDSPKTFNELCEKYYTPAKSLRTAKATWEWRNEIDCLLNFAFSEMKSDYSVNGIRDLWSMLLNGTDKDVKVILTDTNKCVGWMVDGQYTIHPNYKGMKID